MAQLFNPLRKLIATVSLSGTLYEKIEAAASAGFDAVEIFDADLLSFDGTPEDVRHICDGLGLSIAIYQPFRDFEAVPEQGSVRSLERAERKFDVMQALGTDLMLVCSNLQPAAIADDARRCGPCGTSREGIAAQLARRLSGARIGTARKSLESCLADRSAGGASVLGPHPRQLPHAGRQ